MSSKITIAHISDLHYPYWEENTFTRLKNYLQSKNPHLILVTGDLADQPWPWLHRKVRDRLLELREACNNGRSDYPTRLAVVPGNHDYAILGNWNLGTSLLWRYSFRWHFKEYREYCFEIAGDGFKTIFFCFNSNPLVARWAKGVVSGGQLRRFQKKIAELQQGKEFNAAYKIAVLHHHPLPIPHSEKLERFLILKNAGEVLRIFAQCKIDLILHGHKHDSAISSVNMGTAYASNQGSAFSVPRRIFIVASGSTLKAGLPENTCNIITISRTSQAEVVPVGAWPGTEFKEKEAVLLPSRHDFIREHHISARSRLGYEIDLFEKKIEINPEGDGFTHTKMMGLKIIDLQNYRIHKKEEIDPFELQTLTGRIVPDQPIKSSTQGQPQVLKQESPRAVKGSLNLPETIDTNNPIDIEFKFWTVNAWALNAEEFKRKYSSEFGSVAFEEEWIIPSRPTKVFKLIIQLPRKCKPPYPPELSISAPAGDGFSPEPEAGLKRYYRTALNYNEKSNTITLLLKKPLMKYKYVVRWLLPDSGRKTNLKYEGETQELIAHLLQPNPEIKELLKDTEFLLSEEFQIPDNQDIDVSLAIPCEEPGKVPFLKVIADNQDESDVENLPVEIGDGLAGRAFKLNEANFYQELDGKKDPKKMYVPFGRIRSNKFLYCIPLRHPMDQNAVIGVLAIGSHQGFSNLIPAEKNGEQEILKKMIDIVRTFVVLSLSALCGNILSVPSE